MAEGCVMVAPGAKGSFPSSTDDATKPKNIIPLSNPHTRTTGFQGRLEISTVFGLCLRWFCRISCLPDISLVLAGCAVTQPEIRFVNSIVQEHLVSTLRADRLLCQVVLSFLIRDHASRGATEPIYGLRDDD